MSLSIVFMRFTKAVMSCIGSGGGAVEVEGIDGVTVEVDDEGIEVDVERIDGVAGR